MSRTSNDVYITLGGKRLRETDKAVHFYVESVSGSPVYNPRAEWFPFSQMAKSKTDPVGDEEDTITVKEWIVKQKGLL